MVDIYSKLKSDRARTETWNKRLHVSTRRPANKYESGNSSKAVKLSLHTLQAL